VFGCVDELRDTSGETDGLGLGDVCDADEIHAAAGENGPENDDGGSALPGALKTGRGTVEADRQEMSTPVGRDDRRVRFGASKRV
jgi:hypothetical protein